MSFTTRSQPLDTVTEIFLEAINGDDELYNLEARVWNNTTEEYEVFDLSLASRLQFSIKNTLRNEIEYTTDNLTGNITITDSPNGKFKVEIPNADSLLLSIAEMRWDCQATLVDGDKKKTLVRGPILVVDGVTT